MEASDVEKLAREAGMKTTYMNMGAASCVFTEGCQGVEQGALERFAQLVEARTMERAAQIAELHFIPGHSVAGPQFAAAGAAAIRYAAQKG